MILDDEERFWKIPICDSCLVELKEFEVFGFILFRLLYNILLYR